MAKINLFEKMERAEFNLVQAQNARKTYNDLIVANSCFYECLIVEAIAELVTTIEGRKFISTDAILFYMEPIKNGRKGKIIIDEGIYSYYHYSDLSTYKPTTETLIQNGFIILRVHQWMIWQSIINGPGNFQGPSL